MRISSYMLVRCGILLLFAAFPVLAQPASANKVEADLNAPFTLEMTVSLDKTGKIAPGFPQYTKIEGDYKTIEFVKARITKLSDSGYFQYLSNLKAKELLLTFTQNETDLIAICRSNLESENRAKSLKSALSLMVKMVEIKGNEPGLPQSEKAELAIIKNMTVTDDGSSVIIKFQMPKTAFWEIAAPSQQATVIK